MTSIMSSNSSSGTRTNGFPSMIVLLKTPMTYSL
jgi:hypothetical protein